MPSPGRLAGAERLARLRPDRFALFVIAVAMLGAGLVLAREATWGVALHWDSIHYIATARNLTDGGGFPAFTLQTGGDYHYWPPLYPLLLAGGGLSVFDPHDVAGPLNAIAFGLTVLMAGRWLGQHVRSRFLAVWGCLALMLAFPLTQIASWAMSDSLFILFTTLALIRIDSFLREGGGRSALLQAAVFTALACLTRYMGIAVLATVAVLLLSQRETAPGVKLRRIGGYALMAFLPLGLWLVRNVLTFGEITVNSRPVDYSPGVLLDLLTVVREWWFPIDAGGRGRAAAVFALLAIACGIGSVRWRSVKRANWGPAWTFACFTAIFTGAHVMALFTGNTWHGIVERHLLPLYLPLLLLAVVALDRATEPGARARFGLPSRAWRGSVVAITLVAALSLWLAYGANLNANAIRLANSSPGDPWNYGSGHWADSEVMRHVVPDGRRMLFSNYSIAVYMHREGFRRYLDLSPWIGSTIGSILAGEEAGDYLVWFHSPEHPNLEYGIDDLRALPELEVVTEAGDGTIFRIR